MDRQALTKRFEHAQANWFDLLAVRAPRILIVQRDNIGDLVLITPFLHALKACLPEATLDVLVNSYNAAAIEHNPDVSRRFSYVKAKHREPGQSRWSIYWSTFALWRELRRARYDLAVLMTGRVANSSLRPALASRAQRIAAFADPNHAPRSVDLAVECENSSNTHVVTRSGSMLAAITPRQLREARWPGELPNCRVYADPAVCHVLRGRLLASLGVLDCPLIGIHVSARKVDQRWPAANFAALMHRLHAQLGCAFMLFWSPGTSQNAQHPGDDGKIKDIRGLVQGLPVFAHETPQLPLLIAGLSLPHILVCSDGGAMHLAAALGCPIVAMFGNSDPRVWHPWGSPYVVLRSTSQKVVDLSVEHVAAAVRQLLQQTREQSDPKRSNGDRHMMEVSASARQVNEDLDS